MKDDIWWKLIVALLVLAFGGWSASLERTGSRFAAALDMLLERQYGLVTQIAVVKVRADAAERELQAAHLRIKDLEQRVTPLEARK